MDLAREDLKSVGVTNETKSIGSNRKYLRAAATPNRKKPKEEEGEEDVEYRHK